MKIRITYLTRNTFGVRLYNDSLWRLREFRLEGGRVCDPVNLCITSKRDDVDKQISVLGMLFNIVAEPGRNGKVVSLDLTIGLCWYVVGKTVPIL